MSGTTSDDGTNLDPARDAAPRGSLDRAAAAGPMTWNDESPTDENSDPEPAETHDSPAALDEERVARGPSGDGDPLSSIYGPPPGDRTGESRE